jgi:hypothetical protein
MALIGTARITLSVCIAHPLSSLVRKQTEHYWREFLRWR